MDSENTTMKRKSSLPHHKGRFFLLFFLFAGFHMMQAVGRPEEAYDHKEIDGGAKIVIAEDAVISGLGNLHITSVKTKKTHTKPKSLQKLLVAKKLQTKKSYQKISKPKQNLKEVYRFSNNPKSDTHLHISVLEVYAFGSTSFSFKCIIGNEVKIIGALILTISIFLTIFYKSRLFSGCYFLQNFQRPPPKLIS